MAQDRRVESLIRTLSDDVLPMVEKLREMGWPAMVHVDEVDGVITVAIKVNIAWVVTDNDEPKILLEPPVKKEKES